MDAPGPRFIPPSLMDGEAITTDSELAIPTSLTVQKGVYYIEYDQSYELSSMIPMDEPVPLRSRMQAFHPYEPDMARILSNSTTLDVPIAG